MLDQGYANQSQDFTPVVLAIKQSGADILGSYFTFENDLGIFARQLRQLGVNLPADYADQRLAFADTLSPEMTSSLHHDLEHGNSLEVEWLSGGVVTLGKKAGVAAPCNRAVWDVLALHAAGSKK